MINLTEREKSERVACCLRAMAHPTRLLIVHHLGQGEYTVSELAKLVETTQSNISQHLTQMKDKGLLASRREGNQVFYRVKDARLLQLAVLMQELFCK